MPALTEVTCSLNMTAQNDDVIDLTNSFTLVDHQNIKGVIIDLESDTNSDAQTEHSTITRTESKRRAKSSVIPRPIPSKRPSIYDLCTPENKVKRKAENSTIVQDQTKNTPKNKNQNNDTDLKHCCPICFDAFGTKPLVSTKCGHVFCSKCITLALKTEPRCPTCRRKLKGAAAMHPIFL
ncbi:hypothetical protein MSG28_011031 [Choristoneura fumiferana]|uniref:Uncharacterized protein n=1 Tax=Choristoneura fumiferana TaxID=7141 RepID=A0ACC0KQK5_CHOFU|nr:hypothetical protein MSG28_011031 [Choristoneura fumiferana]